MRQRAQSFARQAITTKYLGPTDKRGARIVASCEAGRIVVGWNDSLEQFPNHRAAALALAKRLGWGGPWVGGAPGGRSAREGATVEPCRYCGNWVWCWPDRTSKPGEAWCPTRACEARETARREALRSPEERAARDAARAEYVAGRISWAEYCAKVPA